MVNGKAAMNTWNERYQSNLRDYLNAENNVNVNLSAAGDSFTYQWYDPRMGAIAASGQVSK
ncbi:MAG TPA: hypothetical protein VNM22_21705 [Candidatus Limnocylindrales bacterium]|nr:hypothetical protein [Candidatus Limnocylindrales bacterium]